MSGALLAELWLVYPPLFSLFRQVEELESFELWSLHYQFKLLAKLKDFYLMNDIFLLVIRYSLLILLRTCNKKIIIFSLVRFLLRLRLDVVRWLFMECRYLIPFGLTFLVFGELYKVNLWIIQGWILDDMGMSMLDFEAWYQQT
jgi:hypothetical protein